MFRSERVLRVICFEPVFLAFIREAARKAIPDKGFLLAYFLASVQKAGRFGAFLISILTLVFSDMELVNTGRCVRNPLQHKGFRRFQSCRHRPQQTRKCQVRTRLEISAEAGNFVPLILLDIPQHRKSQNRIFFAVSPVFSPTNF